MDKISSDIIKDAIKGSRPAWNTLYAKEKSLVEKIVRYKLHVKGSELDNIVHDIFSRVHSKLNTFSENFSFEPWLTKVSINFCNRYFDKKTKNIDWHSVSIDDISIEKIRCVDNPEILFISNESISNFMKYLNSFSERDSNILYLRYVEAYSYEDISSETSIHISTVKNVIRKYKKDIENYSVEHMT